MPSTSCSGASWYRNRRACTVNKPALTFTNTRDTSHKPTLKRIETYPGPLGEASLVFTQLVTHMTSSAQVLFRLAVFRLYFINCAC